MVKLQLFHDIFDRQIPPLEEAEFLAEERNTAAAWHQVGLARFQKLQFSEAVTDFTKAIDLDSEPWEPYFHRAMGLIIMGKFQDARDDLSQVLARQPHYFPALYNRGRILMRLRHDAEALADFQAAQQLDRRQALRLKVPQAIRAVARRSKGRPTTPLDQIRDWFDDRLGQL